MPLRCYAMWDALGRSSCFVIEEKQEYTTKPSPSLEFYIYKEKGLRMLVVLFLVDKCFLPSVSCNLPRAAL